MYRSIDADTWSDPWFSELPPPSKLIFLYLITNHHVNAAGLCEVTLRVMAFETGLDTEQVERILGKLAPRVMWWKEHNLVWVRNFYRRQRANTNAENFRKSAARIAQDAPAEVCTAIIEQYPELGAPAPPPPKKDAKDTHASGDTRHASASHTNGMVKESVSHTQPIRNSIRTEPVSEQDQQQEQDSGSGNAPAGASGADAPTTSARPSRKPPSKKPKTPIPDPFEVTPAMAEWALTQGMASNFIRDGTEYFVRWAEMHDHRYVDWEAAWRNVMQSRWDEQGAKVVPIRRAQ